MQELTRMPIGPNRRKAMNIMLRERLKRVADKVIVVYRRDFSLILRYVRGISLIKEKNNEISMSLKKRLYVVV
jgi:hypothetical protein